MQPPTSRTAASIWLVDANPLQLPVPPAWWQQLVYDYDKQLRIMPSQRERAYRLCRVVRREARLGLQQMVVHDHPDTRACIKFNIVPVMTLAPHAIYASAIVPLLKSRDLWAHFNGDPNRIVDMIEAMEQAEAAKQEAESGAQLDAINGDSFRHIRLGYREVADVGAARRTRDRHARTVNPLASLPRLPFPLAPGSANRVPSAVPPSGSPGLGTAPASRIVLTDR